MRFGARPRLSFGVPSEPRARARAPWVEPPRGVTTPGEGAGFDGVDEMNRVSTRIIPGWPCWMSRAFFEQRALGRTPEGCRHTRVSSGCSRGRGNKPGVDRLIPGLPFRMSRAFLGFGFGFFFARALDVPWVFPPSVVDEPGDRVFCWGGGCMIQTGCDPFHSGIIRLSFGFGFFF